MGSFCFIANKARNLIIRDVVNSGLLTMYLPHDQVAYYLWTVWQLGIHPAFIQVHPIDQLFHGDHGFIIVCEEKFGSQASQEGGQARQRQSRHLLQR